MDIFGFRRPEVSFRPNPRVFLDTQSSESLLGHSSLRLRGIFFFYELFGHLILILIRISGLRERLEVRTVRVGAGSEALLPQFRRAERVRRCLGRCGVARRGGPKGTGQVTSSCDCSRSSSRLVLSPLLPLSFSRPFCHSGIRFANRDFARLAREVTPDIPRKFYASRVIRLGSRWLHVYANRLDTYRIIHEVQSPYTCISIEQ